MTHPTSEGRDAAAASTARPTWTAISGGRLAGTLAHRPPIRRRRHLFRGCWSRGRQQQTKGLNERHGLCTCVACSGRCAPRVTGRTSVPGWISLIGLIGIGFGRFLPRAQYGDHCVRFAGDLLAILLAPQCLEDLVAVVIVTPALSASRCSGTRRAHHARPSAVMAPAVLGNRVDDVTAAPVGRPSAKLCGSRVPAPAPVFPPAPPTLGEAPRPLGPKPRTPSGGSPGPGPNGLCALSAACFAASVAAPSPFRAASDGCPHRRQWGC